MKLLVILFVLKSYARVKIFIYFWNLWFSTFFLMFQAITWRVRKNFLHFSKWNFFTSCLKNPVLFLGEPLGSSISCCFHFFLFSFLHVSISSFSSFLERFLLLIAFFNFTVSSLFVRYFVFVLLPRVLQIWNSAFYSLAFFAIDTPSCFYQGFSGALSSALKVAGLPTEGRNTGLLYLFVWITQCSATIW